jgi:FkbM family methyltransferase
MNIFLDCGTHFGQGLYQIIKSHNIDSSWHVETYEANPITYDRHLNKRQFDYVNYKNIGVYDRDGKIEFNVETPPNEDDTGMGSSLIDLSLWNPWGGTLRENFKIKKEIDCFDFSKYIKNNFKIDDYIICKLDIEGAEYPVLEKMIKDETVPYIKKLYVEFHSNFFTNEDEMKIREDYIRSKYYEYGLKIEYWG